MSLIRGGGGPESVCVALSATLIIKRQLGQYLSLGVVHVFPMFLVLTKTGNLI